MKGIDLGGFTVHLIYRQLTRYTQNIHVSGLTTAQLTLLLILWLCVIIILANFLEETVFIVRHFQIAVRRKKTVCVLALMPVSRYTTQYTVSFHINYKYFGHLKTVKLSSWFILRVGRVRVYRIGVDVRVFVYVCVCEYGVRMCVRVC